MAFSPLPAAVRPLQGRYNDATQQHRVNMLTLLIHANYLCGRPPAVQGKAEIERFPCRGGTSISVSPSLRTVHELSN